MILSLDTSTPTCHLWLDDDHFSYETHRTLARDLLSLITDALKTKSKSLSSLTSIIIYKGPGSFTGLRIGLSVANTLADTLNIPIIGATDEDWRQTAQKRLKDNENDKIVLPLYNSPPNTTTPKS